MEEKKKVLVPVGDGCEEIETVSIVDVLRRAGAEVTLASIMGKNAPLLVKGSNGITLACDKYFEDCENLPYDMITLPGGLRNAQLLADYKALEQKLKLQKQQDKYYTAICASPAYVFEKYNFFKDENGTCHPSCINMMTNQKKIDERVVVSGKCITSRGPGTSLEFALTLVEHLFDKNKAQQLIKAMVVKI